MDSIKIVNDSLNVIVKGIDSATASSTCFIDKYGHCIIICITLIIIIAFLSLLWYFNNKNSMKLAKEKQDAEIKQREKKPEESPEDKERRDFVKFCYETVHSTDMKNEDIKEQCWNFLKSTYTNGNIIIKAPGTSKSNEKI